MNILTTENLQKHNTKNRSAGVGEWVVRNGVWAMDIRPDPFYQNCTIDGSTSSCCLYEEFAPNTQYFINLWIDADDVIYQDINRAGGLYLYYTDGTGVDFIVNKASDGAGWHHKTYITDSVKNVLRLGSYYYTNSSVYYRYDSFIVPLNGNTKLNKTGVFNCGEIIESLEDAPTKIGDSYIMTGQKSSFVEW